MKNLFFLVWLALFVCPNVITAQNPDPFEKEKKQIIEMNNRWVQEVLINQNIDIVKEFYPKSGVFNEISNERIIERTVDDLKEELLANNEVGELIDVKSPEGLNINISKDGQTATIYTTVEFVMEKRNFFNKYICVITKEDERWVRTLEEFKMAGERKDIEVDKSILDEYCGTYKSNKTENSYAVSNDGKNIIFTSRLGTVSAWIPQTESSFFMEGQSPTITFGRDKNGKVSHYTIVDGNYIGLLDKVDVSPTLVKSVWKKYESSRGYNAGGDPFSDSEEKAGFVKSIGDNPEGNSTLWARMDPDNYIGKRVKLTATLKTEDVEKGASMMMRVNGEEGKILSVDDMRNRALKASTDWNTYDIVLEVPENSKQVFLGVTLEGKGQVWAKDMKLTIVDESVAITDNYDRWVDDLYSGNYQKAIPTLEESIKSSNSALDKYNSIYYYIALMETGQKEKANKFIADFAKTQQNDEWVTQVACFLCGDLKEKKLLKASIHENATTDKEQKCEAYYYMGMIDKYNNNLTRAKECFEKCLATERTNFVEYNLAQLELKSL